MLANLACSGSPWVWLVPNIWHPSHIPNEKLQSHSLPECPQCLELCCAKMNTFFTLLEKMLHQHFMSNCYLLKLLLSLVMWDHTDRTQSRHVQYHSMAWVPSVFTQVMEQIYTCGFYKCFGTWSISSTSSVQISQSCRATGANYSYIALKFQHHMLEKYPVLLVNLPICRWDVHYFYFIFILCNKY